VWLELLKEELKPVHSHPHRYEHIFKTNFIEMQLYGLVWIHLTQLAGFWWIW